MTVDLTLLHGVRWKGTPVAGERPQALLAALAAGEGRTVAADRLVELIWGERPPANGAKALQVVVSRTRAACGADAVVSGADGYRLGVPADRVDAGRLTALLREARRLLGEDPAAAADRAREAVALGDGHGDAAPGGERSLALRGSDHHAEHTGDGPLAALARTAAAETTDARVVLARAGARTGATLDPATLTVLEQAHRADPDDEGLLADLLRLEATVRGPSAAVERFEAYRRDLRDRLGTSPGEALQRLQRLLLSEDEPVREGVRFDANALLGRADDVRRLRSLLTGARVVSILGPGGLGKTRLAHVLARDAPQPVVHVVELVGVTSPDDLVGEVGSALGVRESVSGRRTLTPQQRADVQSRIAQRLDQAPSLLVLDNCEHLIEAVASLVAFLVAGTAELRVLTTTRAPLAIAAERVYPLGALQADDAIELFRQRAVAARPGVHLDDAVVAGIVARLDGLPLAVELAAAKVRVMSAQDIDRRLEDRFTLLRGGDRSAPDRHQTLLAVIDWSWNLLGDEERRALRWLSVFHDGFTLEGAESLLGDGALDAVQNLADQSLLSVVDTADGGVRHRMLETVREFGRIRLDEAGEADGARAAHHAWARAFCRREGPALHGAGQIAAVDVFATEEGNLADVLRQALTAEPIDPAAVVELVAGLANFWTLRGDHMRVVGLIDPITDALRDWTPEPALLDAGRAAVVVTLTNAMIVADERVEPLRALLRRVVAMPGGDPALAAAALVMAAYDPSAHEEFHDRLATLAEDPDRRVARIARQWMSYVRENSGDPAGAAAAAEAALAVTQAEDGPWAAAILHTQLAQLMAHLGDVETATVHAAAALPILERLGARDDLLQLRSLMCFAAITDGRLDDAAADIAAIERAGDMGMVFGGGLAVLMSQAELALAQGDARDGLARYRRAVTDMRELSFPGLDRTGIEPWVMFAESTALTAFARHGGPEDDAYVAALLAAGRKTALAGLTSGFEYLDLPAVGLLLFAFGAWTVLREGGDHDEAARLLVLADRFAYNRAVPTMAWEPIAGRLEAVAPGRLAAAQEAFGERRGPELLAEAAAAVERLGPTH